MKPPLASGENRCTEETLLARVTEQLMAIERRDWREWLVYAVISVFVAAGFAAVLFPSVFLRNDQFHFELAVSKELFFGFVAVLVVFNTYSVWKRIELRRTRERLIATTIQSELIRLQSFTDPLTEVYNRRSLEDMAGRFISRARRLQKPLTFALVDVDRFKDVNTRFGHLTGDFVLAEIAAVLRNCVRGADAVVRYGGDEFVLMLTDAGRDGSQVVIQRISHFVNEWNRAGHLDKYTLTLSIGVAEWRDGMTLDEVLDEADRDMFVKKSGDSPDAAGRAEGAGLRN